MSIRISFNHPSFVGKELAYIAEAIQGEHISGDGRFTKMCNRFLEEKVGVKRSILTTSCTDALEMTALLLNLTEGDEILVPSFTFVSSINAFALRGAKPIFVDIRKDTLNIDENLIEQKISPRTKAIVVVHYAGVACEMDAILKIASKYGIPVIEDNAHGLFGLYKGRALGSMGQMATLSFHETKNFTCGEGGALLLNDPQFIDRAEIIRDKGTNRKKFLDGLVDKYTWVDLGSSFLMSDILAAFLYAQLENYESVQKKRQKAWQSYDKSLSILSSEKGFQTPYIPSHCTQAYHMYYLLCENRSHRDHMIRHLKQNGSQAVFHYLPLHLSPMGKTFNGYEGLCPVSEETSERLVRLPFFTEIHEDQILEVVEHISTL